MQLAKLPELISFKLCPYVQRSVVTLLEKQIPFRITYIDLSNKPQWFLDISPMGKVPVLRLGRHVLFESAVINEYLDEIHPPSLQPKDPLKKALQRSWIEFGSSILVLMYQWTTCEKKDAGLAKLKEIQDKLKYLEQQVQKSPFFNGKKFSLIDAAFASLFLQLSLIAKLTGVSVLAMFPSLESWSKAVLARDSVKNSVVEDYSQLFEQALIKRKFYLMQ